MIGFFKRSFIVYLLLPCGSLLAQDPFTRLTINAQLEEAMEGVVWFDENADGLIDLVFEGDNKIYLNNGDGSFTVSARQLPEIGYLWMPADFDGNGTTDILYINGYEFNVLTNSNGEYTQSKLSVGDLYPQWIDVEGDGDLDLYASTPYDHPYPNKLLLYINEGGSFRRHTLGYSVESPDNHKIYFNDMDRDGDKDLVVLKDMEDRDIFFYRNKGEMTYELDTAYELGMGYYSQLYWGDANSDGYSDFLLSGFTNQGQDSSTLYINHQDFTFAASTQNFEDFGNGTADWGDYNNDGHNDLLIANGQRVVLHQNNGDGSFGRSVLLTNNANFTHAYWMDINEDGYLDFWIKKPSCSFFSTGCTNTSKISFYLNNAGAVANNTPPNPFTPTFNASEGRIEWTQPGGDETPEASMQYNVRLNKGEGHLVFPYVRARTNGFFWHPQANNGHNTFFSTQYLEAGDYTLSVQAIDGAHGRSDFSPSLNFSIDPGPQELELVQQYRDSLTIRWSLPATADELILERAADSGSFEQLAVLAGDQLQYTDLSIPASDSLRYRLKSVASGYSSAYSEVLIANTLAFELITYPLENDFWGAFDFDWGDFDGDGDLDVVAMDGNSPMIRIYRNNLNGNFELVREIPNTEYYTPKVSWKEINHDNQLDILLSYNYDNKTRVLLNKGEGNFELLASDFFNSLPSRWKMADFDGDALAEVVYLRDEALWLGSDAMEAVKIYDFDSLGIYYNEIGGELLSGDFNRDGYQDILFLGNRNSYFLGTGDLSFTKASLPDSIEMFTVRLNPGSIRGDLNNDGAEDLMLSYQNFSNRTTFLSMSFTGEGPLLSRLIDVEPASEANIFLADHNNDGLTDISFSVIYQNNSAEYIQPAFFTSGNEGFELLKTSSRYWGADMLYPLDIDLDGDLDFTARASKREDPMTKGAIYKNRNVELGQGVNEKPAPPATVSLKADRYLCEINWEPGTDSKTPAISLTYNYYLYRNGSLIVSPAANLATGTLYKSAPGNNGFSRKLILANLAAGAYKFAVQSVDNGFAASTFSEELTFDIQQAPVGRGLTQMNATSVRAEWEPQAWATGYLIRRSDNPLGPFTVVAEVPAGQAFFEDTDLKRNASYYYRITAFSQNAVSAGLNLNITLSDFLPLANPALPANSVMATELADFDRDGDLDMSVIATIDAKSDVHLYKNDGNGLFAYFVSFGLAEKPLKMHWSDLNGDNLPDLAVTSGENHWSMKLDVFFQAGSGEFQPTRLEPGLDFEGSALTSGDFDNNGTVDLVTGTHIFSGDSIKPLPFDNIYSLGWSYTHLLRLDIENDGDHDLITAAGTNSWTFAVGINNKFKFSVQSPGSMYISGNGFSYGDFDADGRWDFVVAGIADHSSPGSYFSLSKPGDTFEKVSLESNWYGPVSVTAGDFDNNGLSDVFFSGGRYSATGTYELFKAVSNMGNKTYQHSNIALDASDGSRPLLADLDGDTDLDLVMTNVSNDTLGVQVYRNVLRHASVGKENLAPSSPENFQVELDGNEAVFSWSAATDGETPQASLTYNLYLKREDGSYLLSPLTHNNKLLIPAHGNTGFSTSWALRDLKPGKYTWGVQAVDAGYRVSGAFEESTFEVITAGIREPLPFVELFPSPTELQLTVRNLPPAYNKIQLADIAGRVIRDLDRECMGPACDELVVDVADLDAGIYLITFIADHSVASRRFIKQ